MFVIVSTTKTVAIQNLQVLRLFQCLRIYPPPPPHNTRNNHKESNVITVHILHDNTLTQDNCDKFIQIAHKYNQDIKFYNVEKSLSDKVAELKSIVPALNTSGTRTVGNLYRFFMAKILREKTSKIIYLDSDVIINRNVAEIWQIDLGDKIIAAVPEVESYVNTQIHTLVRRNIVAKEDYFNSGFMVINLKKFADEEKNITEGIKFRVANTDCDCTDQDVFNYCYSKNYLKLPGRFNTLVEYARDNKDFNIEQRICHYVTSAVGRGFGLDMKDNFNKLWVRYFSKTPWFNENILGRMYEGFQKIYNEQKILMIQISKVMSDKKRAFFTYPHLVEGLKNIFEVKTTEEIISATSNESLHILAKSMKNSRGKKIFILVLQDYFYCAMFLKQAGFIEGKDFIDGRIFLSEQQGMPLNPYSIIKMM